SVISVEETAKVEAFLENEQRRKMRFKGKGAMRMKNQGHYPRSGQSFSNMQSQHHQPQYSSSNQVQSFQGRPTQSQSRKILINPHFRGVRLPPPASTEQVMPVNPVPQPSVPPVSYEAPQNYVPPVYSHHDNTHQVNINPPVFSAPPPIPYKPPEYSLPPPPQQHIQQAPPPIWQQPPPEIPPPVSYAAPPPPLNYVDPMAQVPSYHNNYNPSNFPNTNYAPPQIPPPQVINYNQPPPPVHVPPPSYPPASVTSAQTNVTPVHFQASQPRQQQSIIQKSYQEKRPISHSQSTHMQRKNQNQLQQFARPPEKRASNLNIKQVPVKQPRLENQIRKNVHVNNSNIREIPLVDTLPTTQKTVSKSVPVVEEEDEKTKELRRKIEEQKLLREQILKRKEERRRQMAAQRLMDLKKRQAEQNKNVIAIQRVDQAETTKASLVQIANKAKVSVKERIGVPPATNAVNAGKKKIVVVRKKLQSPINAVSNEQKKAVPITQRLGVQAAKQLQKVPVQKKVPTNITLSQTQATKPKTLVSPSQQKQTTMLQKTTPSINSSSSNTNQQLVTPNASQSNENQTDKSFQNKKGSVLQRLGNRGNSQKQFQQRPPFSRMGPPSPRFSGPRTPQFQNPLFSEPRLRFPPPGPGINDMRMQGPPPFQEPRPPLLPFHSHRERGPFNPLMFENRPRFRMQGPGFQNFRPMGMDIFPDRFPPPQFPSSQMPPMRQFESGGQMFRQRFPGSNARQRIGVNASHPKKSGNINRNDTKTSSAANMTTEDSKSSKGTAAAGVSDKAKETNSHQVQNISNNSENLTCHSVSVENLSSSTSEIQLKKLCSSVGVVENIQLIKDQRKAIIKFKEPSQALNFQKKYQRYMLDLAMIQVSLLTV
ncbi:hypothetical protein AVEN_174397-1, partial [Araneus ventricosus]